MGHFRIGVWPMVRHLLLLCPCSWQMPHLRLGGGVVLGSYGAGGDGVAWGLRTGEKEGLQGGGELPVGRGTDGRGQVRSLSSSGQNSLILSYRYH